MDITVITKMKMTVKILRRRKKAAAASISLLLMMIINEGMAEQEEEGKFFVAEITSELRQADHNVAKRHSANLNSLNSYQVFSSLCQLL